MIKGHVVESQIMLPIWKCFSLTEKQRTINHKIILMIQSLRFTSAAFEAFARHINVFSIHLGKKNAEAIEFLGILTKYVSKNKIYIFLKKEKQ